MIASLVGEFDAEEFENEYRTHLRAMLEAKVAGHEIAAPEPVPEAPVVDLMEALRRSVAEVKERKTPAAAKKPKPAGKAKTSARPRARAKSG